MVKKIAKKVRARKRKHVPPPVIEVAVTDHVVKELSRRKTQVADFILGILVGMALILVLALWLVNFTVPGASI